MANSRIKDISATAASAASDDYLVIDGATNGTRKIAASDVGGGGETMYDFTSTLTPSIDARGVTAALYYVTAPHTADLTIDNYIKMKAYLAGSNNNIYPLIITYAVTSSTSIVTIHVKSIYSSVQNTSSSTISGTLHIVAPFEISSVAAAM